MEMDYEEDDQLEWRDTYFILFQQSGRPTLTQVEAAITDSARHIKLENLEADEDGMFESVLVQAPRGQRGPGDQLRNGRRGDRAERRRWPSSSRARRRPTS